MLAATPSLRRSTPAATVAATRAFSASSPSSSSSQSTTTSSSSSHNAINPLHYHLFCVAGRGADELVNPEPSSPSRYVAQQKFKPTPVRNPPPLPYRASSGCLLGAGGRWKRSRGALVTVDPARIAKFAGAERGFASLTLVRGVAEESLAEEDGMDGGWEDSSFPSQPRIPTPQSQQLFTLCCVLLAKPEQSPGDHLQVKGSGVHLGRPGVAADRKTFPSQLHGWLLATT
ncbi:hypothetical protein JCM11641_001872 [Rhodosporidiobolus odoratus]